MKSLCKKVQNAAWKRGARGKCVGNSPADTKVREGGAEEVFQAPKQRLLCSPWRRPRWSGWTCPEGAAAHGEPTPKQVYSEGLQPMGRSCNGEGEKSTKAGEEERSCHGLTTVSNPHHLHCWERGGRGVGNEEVRVSMEKRVAVGKLLGFICLSSSAWCSNLFVNKLNSFSSSQVCFAHDSNW